MKKLIQTLLLLLIIFTNSCGNRIYNSPMKANKFLIKIEKSGCYGTCPVYKINLNKKRTVTYQGIRFTKHEGEYKWKLNRKDYKLIKSLITENLCVNISVNMEANDLPTTKINIKDEFHIKFKGSEPKKLDNKLNQIEYIMFKNSKYHELR
tara:strand:+ start:61 stop:513 length:453 start_codon:yes stop_codon:yes gene_type:complete